MFCRRLAKFFIDNNLLIKNTGGAFKALQRSATTTSNTGVPDKLYKEIQLEIKTCEPAVLRSYQKFIETAASLLNITVNKTVFQDKSNKKRFTVLKSVHVHRKHLVQYEIRTHYAWIYLKNLTGSTADTFLEYIERMLPEGVGLKVTKTQVEQLPSHLLEENINKSIEKTEEAESSSK